jgi:tryptophan synthase
MQLGIPFSDPLADGPTIQAANQTALKNGSSIHTALRAVEAARGQGVTAPIILMGYLNPFLSFSPTGSVTEFVVAAQKGPLLTPAHYPAAVNAH